MLVVNVCGGLRTPVQVDGPGQWVYKLVRQVPGPLTGQIRWWESYIREDLRLQSDWVGHYSGVDRGWTDTVDEGPGGCGNVDDGRGRLSRIQGHVSRW